MSSSPHAERILRFEEARNIVEEAGHSLLRKRIPPIERVNLLDSAGCILAEEVTADRELPPFNRATRDGFAVRAEDLAQASETAPVSFRVVGETRAGAPQYRGTLKTGEALAIMTGAPVPADNEYAVVMVEYTTRNGEEILVRRSVAPGENIVPAGSEAGPGAVLLHSGHRIDYAAVAVAASVGKTNLLVYRRPRVAILSTGDEIVEISTIPEMHQIRNSNSYSLATQVAAAGGGPMQLPIAPDDLPRLRELIAEGLQSDLLLLSGGVSMGEYDLVERVLAEFGAEFLFTGALIQPGKPIVFGRVCSGSVPHYFFGLPGNPVSTMVTFELFVRPMIDALRGAWPEPLQLLPARLKSEIKTKTGLTRFLPAFLKGTEVEMVRWQGSGDIVATAQANCYVVIPPDRSVIPAGEIIEVLLRR